MHIECIYAWISCPLRIHACCINSYYLELKRVQSNVLYVLPLFSFCENVLLKERKSVLYLYVNSSFFLRQNWFDIYSGQKFGTTITCVVTCRYVISQWSLLKDLYHNLCIQTLRLNSKSIAITKNADHIFTLSLECWYIHFILSIYSMFYRLSKLHSFIALDLDIHLVNNESLLSFSENSVLMLENVTVGFYRSLFYNASLWKYS